MSIFENPEQLPYFRATTSASLIKIKSEPMVVFTKRGYQPVVVIEDVHAGNDYLLFISAQSLTDPLEELRHEKGSLSGAQMLIKKQSEERASRYSVSIL